MPAQLQTLSLSRLNRLRRQELVQRHVLRLIFLGLVAVSLAGLLYLTQASAVTTTTYEIQELQSEIQRLQRRRDRLRADIAVLTSPAYVEARARALGFRTLRPTEFLVITDVPGPALSSAKVVARRSLMPSTLERAQGSAGHGTGTAPLERPPAPLERLLARTSSWLKTVASVLPAPRRVEAGPVHQ